MEKNITCPYCGHKALQKLSFNVWWQQDVVTCPLEDMGCDKDFIVKRRFVPETTTRKIED